MQTNKLKLYYCHDPMCSWCWGFKPTWQTLQRQLAQNARTRHIHVTYLLGGLAKDTDQPMAADMQNTIQETWRYIQQVIPTTAFNFDFWTNNTPRRSTYPACRAVIAARKQALASEQPMIDRIQKAYYLQAQNPSDIHILSHLAVSIGLDKQRFEHDLNSPETQQELVGEIRQCESLGANGFPSLILQSSKNTIPLQINYNQSDEMFTQLLDHL